MCAIKKRVFIIDDDSELYQTIRQILQRWGIEVDFFSAHDVMMQISRFEIGLIIINITPPSLIRLELVKQIRKIRVIPILVLSCAGVVKRIDAFRAGAHGYLEAPYTPEECAKYAQSLQQFHIKTGVTKERKYDIMRVEWRAENDIDGIKKADYS